MPVTNSSALRARNPFVAGAFLPVRLPGTDVSELVPLTPRESPPGEVDGFPRALLLPSLILLWENPVT